MNTSAKRLLATVLAAVMILPSVPVGAAGEAIEKPAATFSASDFTDQRLLYGSTFYTDWKTGDGLPNDTAAGKGADLSGTAANGAHKKMFLKTTVTLTATDGNADTCWTKIGFRLRSARVDSIEKASDFKNLSPADLSMTGGVAEVSIPLADIGRGGIDWADVRQLIVTCEVKDEYRLPTTGNSDVLSFALSGTRIVREMTEGEVDTDELRDLVAMTVKEENYTADSVAALRQTIADGQALLADENATQEQVDAAIAAIKAAKAALVSSREIFKDTLRALMEIVVLDEPGDPQAQAFAQKQRQYQSLLADENATQKQINNAVMDLSAAKMALDRRLYADEPFETLADVTPANAAYTVQPGGTQVYTDWKNVDGGALNAAGDAFNGADALIYLQMEVRFVALSENADPADCCKQIAVRLRSSQVDGKNMEANFFYASPDMLIDRGGGWYTLRIPLRAMATADIDWADVRQLNTIIELTDAYRLTDEDDRALAVEDIGVVIDGARLARKIVATPGDVDGDGGVTAADALLALQASTDKVTLPTVQMAAANVDGADGITAADALMILQAATDKITLEEPPMQRKMVAFTFDDGPSENTEALLDALKERGAHATFFVIGTQVEQRPELLARMVAEGHEVGNHSYSHDGFNKTTREQMIEEYGRCSDLIEQYTGQRPTLMRAVGGTSTEGIRDFVREQNLRQCGWVGGGDDYNQTDPAVVVNFYMKNGQCTISDGDLVLLHENHASSVEAALQLIDLLQADGFEFVTVRELLDARLNGGVGGMSYSHVVDLS